MNFLSVFVQNTKKYTIFVHVKTTYKVMITLHHSAFQRLRSATAGRKLSIINYPFSILFVSMLLMSFKTADERAAEALAHRVMGDKASAVAFQQTDSPTDSYELVQRGRQVLIKGNNANSMAVGLNRYLQRERELNMTPVLPAFAGHVPAELAEVVPEKLKTSRVSRWCNFDDQYRCTYLSPTDPLFARIQKDFLEEQTRMYGTDHVYGVDLFNEVSPPSWNPNTLAHVL